MRVAGALWSLTLCAGIKASLGFSTVPENKDFENEENYRLLSIF
jgi:hypothetical protein